MNDLYGDFDLARLLNLMFNPGETVCSSSTVYASESKQQSEVTTDEALLAVNPINGWKCVAGVTAFRTLLVEVDPPEWDSLEWSEKLECLRKQYDYIANSGLPFSACIYSGNKSYHFLLVMDRPFESQEDYRFHFRWVANILPAIDRQTGSGIHSVRVPGHVRKETGQLQRLKEIRGRIERSDLLDFLNKHPSAKPVEIKMCTTRLPQAEHSPLAPGEYGRLSGRTLFFLATGADKGYWHEEFRLAVKDLKAQGYSREDAHALLERIEGHLDETSRSQLRYGYDNSNWEMSFRPFTAIDNDEEGGSR